jgi:hypothetical protein
MSSRLAQPPFDPIDSPAAAKASMSHFATLMSNYSLALQAFVNSRSPYFTPKDEIAIAVLQLHVLSSYISLFSEQSPQDTISSLENFDSQSKEMIRLAEKIISSTSPANNPGPTTSFCLDLGVVIPLYTVASQRGDPVIRRKAIALLRSTARQEGLWNSFLIAKAAERIMEIEESEPGETSGRIDGPDRVRPLNVRPTLEIDGKGGHLEYSRRGEGANTQIKVVEKVFGW